MKRHVNVPAAWLLMTGGCGGMGAILCQCGLTPSAALMGFAATVAFFMGAVKTRVFYG
jgi:hypothetical protein